MEKSKINLARIKVQHAFCNQCASEIKSELLTIEGIANVVPYPMDSLVVFHFASANALSVVLNKLMEIGHPPHGDLIKEENYVPPFCQCSNVSGSAA